MLVGRSLRPLQDHQSCLAIQFGHPQPNVLEGSRGQYFAGLEVRPESYVEILGPTLRVSAAHNVALPFGAVLGYMGLVMWIIAFFGTGFVLLVQIVRVSVT